MLALEKSAVSRTGCTQYKLCCEPGICNWLSVVLDLCQQANKLFLSGDLIDVHLSMLFYLGGSM